MKYMSEQEFLESGILEQYVMDLLPAADKVQAEEYIHAHPQVHKAYEELQNAIRTMADEHGIDPPAQIRASILKKIGEEPSPIKAKRSVATWFLPAAILLGVVFTSLSYMKVHQLQHKLQHQEDTHRKAMAACDLKDQQNRDYAEQVYFYSHHATKSTTLQAAEQQGFQAVAFYNKEAQKMTIEVLEEAPLPSGQCLYLWGDRHGEMIKIARLDQVQKHQLMTIDGGMDSFNITIEDATVDVEIPTVTRLLASTAI